MPSGKLLWLLPLLIFSACGSAEFENEWRQNSAVTNETAVDTVADEPYGANATGKNRKLIRTADIECHVGNVLDAVTQLERNVKAAGGVVEHSSIDNNAAYPRQVVYKADSIKQVQVCHTSATLTLRIPSDMLDSVVNSIPGRDSYVVSRKMAQQDVTFKYMTNALLNKPGGLTTPTKALELAEDSRDAIEVQRYADTRKEQFVNRHVENLKIMDNVAFATLTVRFTQPETVLIQTLVNTEYVTKATFGAKLGVALRNGTMIIEGIAVGLVTIWPLVLLIGAIMWVVLYVRKRRGAAIKQFERSTMG